MKSTCGSRNLRYSESSCKRMPNESRLIDMNTDTSPSPLSRAVGVPVDSRGAVQRVNCEEGAA